MRVCHKWWSFTCIGNIISFTPCYNQIIIFTTVSFFLSHIAFGEPFTVLWWPRNNNRLLILRFYLMARLHWRRWSNVKRSQTLLDYVPHLGLIQFRHTSNEFAARQDKFIEFMKPSHCCINVAKWSNFWSFKKTWPFARWIDVVWGRIMPIVTIAASSIPDYHNLALVVSIVISGLLGMI